MTGAVKCVYCYCTKLALKIIVSLVLRNKIFVKKKIFNTELILSYLEASRVLLVNHKLNISLSPSSTYDILHNVKGTGYTS